MRRRFDSRVVHIWLFLIYFAMLVVPLGFFLALRSWLFGLFGHDWWILPFSVTMGLALVAPFVYVSLQRRAQEQFLERQRQYQQTFLQAAPGMTMIKEMRRLLDLIVHILTRTAGAEQASLWLLEKTPGKLVVQASRGSLGFDPQYTIGLNQPLIQYLIHQKNTIVLEELRKATSNGRVKYLVPVVEEMTKIGAAVIIPSFVGERLLGFVAMGSKKSGQPYIGQDLEIFEVMANQAALAIENAQFYEELQRTQTDLFQTAKMASLGHMAGGMSHQINNRFHTMSILAGVAKSALQEMNPRSIEAEKLQELWASTLDTLEKVEQNAIRGGDIVKTLLNFSRPSAEGEHRPVAVSKILATARDVAQFRVNFNFIDLIEEIPGDLPLIRGNMNQLADSLLNLISNAFDAIQKKVDLIQSNQLPNGPQDPAPYRGQIRIRARREESEGKDWVILEFQDNGIGMAPQELEHLFIPFFTTKATSQKGTGLGLYVIQRIIERHGGTISANSAYGVGTTFVIRLPAEQTLQPHA